MKIELNESQVSLISDALNAYAEAAAYENDATNDPEIHESNDKALHDIELLAGYIELQKDIQTGDLIEPAKNVWNNQPNKDDFKKACESVMRAIKKASGSGFRNTCFDPRPTSMYDAVKSEFKKNGYSFKPTGIIGGVYQDSEQICW